MKLPVVALLTLAAARGAAPGGLERLRYKHPGLVVDLGVGLWAWPLPMDYDGDGDLDLVVSCADVPYNGTYLFENPGGDAKMPVFKPAVKLDRGMRNVQLCTVGGQPRVLTPATEYRDFRRKRFSQPLKLPAPSRIRLGKLRANQWKYADFDGDGTHDLVVGVGDWTAYGWDNAFNAQGEWTRGPLHGFVYRLRNTGTSDKPSYAKPVQIQARGKSIDVYGMPSPNLADFDGDGDLDILCGSFIDRLTYFQNVGTRTEPKYAAGRELVHGGEPLRMELCMIVPVAIDWDRDGDVDLVVGEEDGRVALVEHTGKVVDGLPQFLPQQQFQQQADCVKFGALATPVGFDWDGDGDEDLVCGNTAGHIGFVENLDGGDPPKWAKPVYLEADGEILRIQAGPNGSIQGPCEAKWGYTTLSVADWDGDGLPDIVANSIWGKVVWYRNAGSRKRPKLAAAQPVTIAWEGKPPKPAWNWWQPEGNQLATQWRTSPVAIDWNRDGLGDLVMLDREGYLAFFERAKRDGKLALLPPRRIFLAAGTPPAPLRLNARSAGRSGRRKLCFADWDRDGRTDLLVNSRNVAFLRNVADAPDGGCVLQSLGDVAARRLAGHTTSPTVVDWDRDGTPDLLVGAEDGFFYYLKNPHPIARKPVGGPSEHLVAAWDFEAGRGGPLADKATASETKDALKPLGAVEVARGVAHVPRQAGSGLQAASSADLEQAGEITIWVRLRVATNPTSFISLVDKRRFKNPEERSYGLYIPPGPTTPAAFAVGGQISSTGSARQAAAFTKARETLPVGAWCEAAMVVERRGYQLAASWWAAPKPGDGFQQIGGPVSHSAVRALFRSKQPLLVGDDVNLTANSSALDLDEVRLYNRALTPAELDAIEPGALSR